MSKSEFSIITLCGSTKFKEEYRAVEQELTLQGYIVLACPVFHHKDGIELPAETSNMLRRMHKARIDMANEVCVINKGGYIGAGTQEEIEYATIKGKKVVYMEKSENK